MGKDITAMGSRMTRLESAWPIPTSEVEERCLQVLESHDALDVAQMLGLSK